MKPHSWFVVAILASLLLFAAYDDDDDSGDMNDSGPADGTAMLSKQ